MRNHRPIENQRTQPPLTYPLQLCLAPAPGAARARHDARSIRRELSAARSRSLARLACPGVRRQLTIPIGRTSSNAAQPSVQPPPPRAGPSAPLPPTAAGGGGGSLAPRTAVVTADPSRVSAPIDLARDSSSRALSAKAVALQAKMRRLADMCHLSSAVSAAIADGWIDGVAEVGGADLWSTLRAGSRKRAESTIDLDRACTSLEWLADFVAATGRRPFLPMEHASDLRTSVYNSETLEGFAEYIRVRGSRQRGRVGTALASDTVDGYVSTVKTLASIAAHHSITLEAANTIRPRASKAVRRQQAPPGARQIRRGLRATHLRQLIAKGYDRSSARGIIEWAAALVAWNLLLRGGELGVVTGRAFDPSRDATFGAIEWRAPCRDSSWLPWLTWDVVPVKDFNVRRRACPMPVQRRHAGALGADPMCVYDAIVAAWTLQAGAPPPSEGRTSDPSLASRAFFIARSGSVWDTDETRRLACRMAAALGLDPTEFGGKTFRIGGATDWRDVFGADAERVITQRGRWHSDIAHVYQRALAETQLRGSASVANAERADLESLCKGWCQPATF